MLCRKMLAAGVEINSADADGYTALHLAVKAGTDISRHMSDGWCLRHHTTGRSSIAEFLVGSGASVNIAAKDGSVPLGLAMEEGHDVRPQCY